MLLYLIDKLASMTPPIVLSSLMKNVPRSFIDWKGRASFQETVRYAYKKSPFYRKRFEELNINPYKIKNPRDLGDFYTLPEDIIAHPEDFLCNTPQIVFESSGTTGRNKRIYFSQEELDWIGRINAMGMFMGGVTRKDRLINAFDFCIWIPGLVTQKSIEKAGVFAMAAGKVDPIEVYKRITAYNFNIVFGEPTWLIKLTEIAERNGSYPLKLIVGGAEAMPDAARPWMEKVWQGAKVLMTYASVESGGVIGFELTSACKGYHINEYDFMPEIVNPDKDGYGEIAFTTLSRRTMPLIRYRNRDIGKIFSGKCECGCLFRMLSKISGRTDEMVITAAGNLYPLVFEEILKDVQGISCDWQIVFKLRGMKEVMEFNLELKGDRDENSIRENIFSNIKIRYPDFWRNLSLGIFETDFAYHKPDTLRQGRKLIRILDRRYDK